MRALFLASTLSLLASAAMAEIPSLSSESIGKAVQDLQPGLTGSTVVLPDDLRMNMEGKINTGRSTVTVGEEHAQCDLLMKPDIQMEDVIHALDHAVSSSDSWVININGYSYKGDYFLFAGSSKWTGSFGISSGLDGPMKLKCVLAPAKTTEHDAPEPGDR